MIAFLSETWSSREHMLWVQNKIRFDGCFTVPTDCRGGVWPFYGKRGLLNRWIVFRVTILIP